MINRENDDIPFALPTPAEMAKFEAERKARRLYHTTTFENLYDTITTGKLKLENNPAGIAFTKNKFFRITKNANVIFQFDKKELSEHYILTPILDVEGFAVLDDEYINLKLCRDNLCFIDWFGTGSIYYVCDGVLEVDKLGGFTGVIRRHTPGRKRFNLFQFAEACNHWYREYIGGFRLQRIKKQKG